MSCLCDSSFWSVFWTTAGWALTFIGAVILVVVSWRQIKRWIPAPFTRMWRELKRRLPFRASQTLQGEVPFQPGLDFPGGRAAISERPELAERLERRLGQMGRDVYGDVAQAMSMAALELAEETEDFAEKVWYLEQSVGASLERQKSFEELVEQATGRLASGLYAHQDQLDEYERSGLWPVAISSLLIPAGLVVSYLVDLCRIGC